LDALKKHHASAIGFVNEKTVEELGSDNGKRILEQWVREGFDLGNHTFSHADLNNITLEQFKQEVVTGEDSFRPILAEVGKTPRFPAFSFNHTGDTKEKHDFVAAFLKQRGYEVAACTIDNEDYLFNATYIQMLAKKDDSAAFKLRAAYLTYTAVEIEYYASLHEKIFGREIPQVMLLHANRLNADVIPSVEWKQGPRKGPSANRNFGARISDCEWLIYMDDDCIPRAGYVLAYLNAFAEANQTNLFHGLTFPLPEIPSLLYEAPKLTGPNKIFWSCNFAIRKSLFEATGGFDERYFLACFEDVEFSCRLDLLGARVGCVEGAVVDHPLRQIQHSSKLAKRWEVRVISTLDFGATPLQVAIRLPKHVLLVILSRFRGAKISSQNLRATLIFVGEFFYFLYFLPGWLRKYAKVPRSRFWTEQDALGRAPARFGL